MPNDNEETVVIEAPFSLEDEFEEALSLEKSQLEEIAQEKLARAEMIASLPDQRVAYVNQQSQYAKSAFHRAEIVRLGHIAAKEAANKYKLANPEAEHLVFRTQSSATLIPQGKEIDIDSFYRKVLEVVLWRSDEFVTQKAILAEVNKDFLHAPQNANRWTATLPKWQLKKMSTFIDGNRPQWGVSLTNCNTLSECRKAMLLAKDALNPNKVAKVTITITPKRVLVDDVAYPISKVKTGNNEYPSIRVGRGNNRKWVRVDALTLLLGIQD